MTDELLFKAPTYVDQECLISGDTYKYKDKIKSQLLGGQFFRWNSDREVWIIDFGENGKIPPVKEIDRLLTEIRTWGVNVCVRNQHVIDALRDSNKNKIKHRNNNKQKISSVKRHRNVGKRNFIDDSDDSDDSDDDDQTPPLKKRRITRSLSKHRTYTNDDKLNLPLSNNKFTTGRRIDYAHRTSKAHCKQDSPQKKLCVKVFMDTIQDKIYCFGNTYDIKETLKEYGFRFDSSTRPKRWWQRGTSTRVIRQICNDFEIRVKIIKQNPFS